MINPKLLLEMQGIRKVFPGVVALNQIYLNVRPNEVVGLIGENGAGKSTLMKLLGGIHTPDAGTIEFEGKVVQINQVSDSINLGIGFIHQELNLLDNLTISENIFLGREPLWPGLCKIINRKKLRRQTRELLEHLSLELDPDKNLKELSIGQQQMVEIAKALSLNVKLLIMDEPTSSLTLTETKLLFNIINQLKTSGISVIYISHRLGEIFECADRVVGLRDGKNAGELSKDEISHHAMVRLMIGRDISRSNKKAANTAKSICLKVNDLCTSAWPDKRISFEAFRGEILGFAGLIGAGRSEMARAIFGVDKLLSGTIELDSHELEIKSARHAIASGIYLVPEDRKQAGLITEMNIRENITLPYMFGFSKFGLIDFGQESKAASSACESLNIKTFSTEVSVKNLSGGNQQKVVLGRGLRLKPNVIIFDEPTRGIDVGAKSEIYQLMRELTDSGVCVIMISSDMEEILNVSDRIAVMHEGGITGFLMPDEFSEEAVMQLAVENARQEVV